MSTYIPLPIIQPAIAEPVPEPVQPIIEPEPQQAQIPLSETQQEQIPLPEPQTEQVPVTEPQNQSSSNEGAETFADQIGKGEKGEWERKGREESGKEEAGVRVCTDLVGVCYCEVAGGGGRENGWRRRRFRAAPRQVSGEGRKRSQWW
ncbi:hypothetical protein POM88_023005 [Heracleum sosnowskyi]|uniref:Uncharacterized protein n=1 Tax=Heracleum sosnowskyi TaxID=360622 RepID=A0AAD8IJV1_9APIA|nr:hypothetical protein POM88_023005 [Heracleum sosnowskyi]